MHINDMLYLTVSLGASDLHLKAGNYPILRLNGELVRQENMSLLSPEDLCVLFSELTTDEQRKAFDEELELDFAYQVNETDRFRINACQQNGTISLSCRPVKAENPSLEDLGLPGICRELVLKTSGLVIVTGPTGSGKSTTLAAMINYLNHTEKRKVITIEDPVEFVHKDINCSFIQRELGRDTKSFGNALKHALRQDPDVILVGEMRDLETMASALTAAETGHLVLTTLHTPGTAQAIDRFIDVFPPYQQQQVRIQLAATLEGVIYQVLLASRDGTGRCPAVEVMVATGAIRNLIREGKNYQLMNAIQTGAQYGMQSLNQSLTQLCRNGKVTREEAFCKCSDHSELREMVDGH